MRGMNNESMQRSNRNLALKILLEGKPVSRVELARKTSLNKATITNIVNELLDSGIVKYDCMQGGAENTEGKGRKAQKLCLDAPEAVVLSVRLTRIYYHIQAYSLDGSLLREIKGDVAVVDEIEHLIDNLYRDIDQLVEMYGADKILGLCLALPGPYVRGVHSIAMVTGFEKLSHIDIQELLEQHYAFPVFSEHDAKLAAFAEWKQIDHMQAKSKHCLLGIQSIGLGIGSGIIIDGKIMQGAQGIAGEIGHMGINITGPKFDNGIRGTFEYYAGMDSVRNYVLERMHEFPKTELSEDTDYATIKKAYLEGEPLALYAFKKLAWYLGYGLANQIFIINPDIIIIGTDYPDDARFIQDVKQAIKEMVQPQICENLEIRASILKPDPTMLGCYYRVVERLLSADEMLDRLKAIQRGRKA